MSALSMVSSSSSHTSRHVASSRLPQQKRNTISYIFDELSGYHHDGERFINRKRFCDLFPMPQSFSNVLFQAFCGHNQDVIDRSRFISCLEILACGGTDQRVEFLFGDDESLQESMVSSTLNELFKGLYLVAFSRTFTADQTVPKFLEHALRARVQEIIGEILSHSSGSKSKAEIALTDLTTYVKTHLGLRAFFRLICRNIASVPGFVKDGATTLSSYRQILQQIIQGDRSVDQTVKPWQSCAQELGLPSPDLESRVHFIPKKVEKCDISTSSSSSSSSSSDESTLSSPDSESELLKPIMLDGITTSQSSKIKSPLPLSIQQSPGIYKLCQNCDMTFDFRYCVECGLALTRFGIELGCERCNYGGSQLRFNFCARCGHPGLVDRHTDPVPVNPRRQAPGPFYWPQRRKKGIHGFVDGDLQDWFYLYDPQEDQWHACWALLSDQFLLIFRRALISQPTRVLWLPGRQVEFGEYHGDHDEYVIEISESGEGRDDGCMLITTEQLIGNQWFQQLRLQIRRRSVEDYYAIGECVFKLNGLVRRCICRHKLTSNKFFITVIDKDVFDAQQIDMIRSSIALLKMLRHPSLITVGDVFESASQFFVTVPHLNGSYLLKSLRREGRFEEPVVRVIIHAVIHALSRIHQGGLLLVNVRPECLIVTPHAIELVQIAHLDLAKFLSPSDILQRGLPRRLLAYRTPEALACTDQSRIWGPAADMWQVGVLMFELLTGELPFRPPTQQLFDYPQVLEDHFRSNQIWENVSNDAKDLIRSLLSATADRRPTAGDLVANAWFSRRL